MCMSVYIKYKYKDGNHHFELAYNLYSANGCVMLCFVVFISSSFIIHASYLPIFFRTAVAEEIRSFHYQCGYIQPVVKYNENNIAEPSA